MNNGFPWIRFKGILSNSIPDIVVTALPSPRKAAQRVETLTVPGRSGTLNIVDGGSDTITLPIKLFAYNRAAADKADAWLCDSGELILSTYPDRVFTATVYDGFEWTEDEDLGTFETTVTFKAHPFPRININSTYTVNDGGSIVIDNPYNVESYPLFKVIRSDTELDEPPAILLTVNGYNVLNITDGAIEGATIDTDIMECWDTNRSQINEYCFEYPVFAAGKKSTITVSGASLIIDPRWRCKT